MPSDQQPIKSAPHITDPVEKMVAEVLSVAGIEFIHGSGGSEGTKGLDFYLPDFDIYIECKRMHTPRTCEQMSRVDNVIVIQGMKAAITFLHLVEILTSYEEWQPISTAPKDGTVIDLWAENQRLANCTWCEDSSSWKQQYSENPGTLFPINLDPTHWMPVPEAP